MRALFGAVRLVHPFPVGTVVGTTLLLIVVVHRAWPGWSIMTRAGLVILLSQIAVGALNDYHDRDVDARVQPTKPIATGVVSPAIALQMVWVSLLLLLPVSLSFGPVAFALSTIGTAAGIAYDLWLKPTPLSLAGYLVGFLSLGSWVSVVAGHLSGRYFLLYPGAALLLVTAHLAQSLPDVETDLATHQRGLAAVLGVGRAFDVMLLSLVLSAIGAAALGLGLHALWSSIAVLPVLAGCAWLRARRDRSRLDLAQRELVFRVVAPLVALTALSAIAAVAAT